MLDYDRLVERLFRSEVVYYTVTWCTFKPKLKHKKKKLTPKNLLMFQEMELSNPKIKKVLIFSKKKAFLIFRETELLKNVRKTVEKLSKLE